MLYGNSSSGFSYSPDRSRDVDRFNPSTRANYSTSYNPYGFYSPNQNKSQSNGEWKQSGSGAWYKD